jgi:hypothetical protein
MGGRRVPTFATAVDHAESKTTDTVIASVRSQKNLSRYGWAPADRPRRPVLFVNPTRVEARWCALVLLNGSGNEGSR